VDALLFKISEYLVKKYKRTPVKRLIAREAIEKDKAFVEKISMMQVGEKVSLKVCFTKNRKKTL